MFPNKAVNGKAPLSWWACDFPAHGAESELVE